jgi:hypothetical protein
MESSKQPEAEEVRPGEALGRRIGHGAPQEKEERDDSWLEPSLVDERSVDQQNCLERDTRQWSNQDEEQ